MRKIINIQTQTKCDGIQKVLRKAIQTSIPSENLLQQLDTERKNYPINMSPPGKHGKEYSGKLTELKEK